MRLPILLPAPSSATPLWSRPGSVLAVAAVSSAALLALLNAWSALDVSVSARFFQSAPCAAADSGAATRICGLFPAASEPLYRTLREIGQHLPVALALATLGLLLAQPFTRGARLVGADVTRLALPIVSIILGPLLLVNMGLKAFWGRPRPFQSEPFGGDLAFVPAGDWSGACASNCSFVSGEAATAFWLFAFVPLLRPRWRWPAGLAVTLFAAAVSFGRIAFGRHFLSDTLMAGALTLTVIALTGYLLQRPVARDLAQRWAAAVNRRRATR